MNLRYTPLQSWERAALDRYAQQNGFPHPSESAFWHTVGALLHGARARDAFANLHFSHAFARRRNGLMPLPPSVKIENRLYSLFAE